MVADANNMESVLMKFLFDQSVCCPIVLNFTVHSFKVGIGEIGSEPGAFVVGELFGEISGEQDAGIILPR